MRSTIAAIALLFAGAITCTCCIAQPAPDPTGPDDSSNQDWWNAADRGRKVAALAPGRRIPAVNADTLFAEWTASQVERWNAGHAPIDADEAYAQYAATAPTDGELAADFPRHIAPFARVRSGSPGSANAAGALISYCPFCHSRTFSLSFDRKNEYHATPHCCHTELFGREQDFPLVYALKPTETVSFLHLDDTELQVPCTVFRDKDGVEWELFIKTIFDQRRWLKIGSNLARQYGQKFRETGDPLYAHKVAVLLDQVADTYFGLPLCFDNKLAMGKDGKPLTRAEWEAVPRPAVFEVSYLGGWNRRTPHFNQGWLNMSDEHIWVEPFARTRHHPAFKHYSQVKYGDPEALDRKVMRKLMRELSLMFKSVFSQKLLTNYQEANYVDLWLLGLLLGDDELIDFAGPAQEVAMYNHTYQDGLNGEGAPNYMAMPGGYFYPYMADPKGWLQYYPEFLEDNPFYFSAAQEMKKLTTVRGLQVEFGDQHEYAFPSNFQTRPDVVADRERTGSRNWAGYGVGILRIGGPGHRQEACLSYTRATLHNAQDALSLGVWVDGVPVMRRGGYAAHWKNAPLQWERPEFQALKKMDYPYEIAEGDRGFDSWSWVYAHSPLCQNGAMVDDTATGGGWGDNRGYGEVITFKGGEAGGEPGSGFQILDVRDHYSWSRVDKDVRDFRRTLIGVEGSNGRPYIVDLLKLSGGQTHTLYNSARAERVQSDVPLVASTTGTLDEKLFEDGLPEDNAHYRNFRQVRNTLQHSVPLDPWSLTWATDMAALAPRDPKGKPFERPLPEGVGNVRLRMVGFSEPDDKGEMISGTGPWIGWLKQPLPGGQRADGNVAFMDARDFLVERRAATDDRPLDSLFIHVLEGFRKGEQSSIRSAERLDAVSTEGPERDIVALRLEMTDGRRDTVIYQSQRGSVRLPDGLETDCRYAVLQQDGAGEIIAVETCRGTSLRSGDVEFATPGDFTGTIEDIIGDLTGTRRESALIIRPHKPWPAGAHLADRQLLVRVESELRDPCNEGYRIAGVRTLPGGLVRVDLQDHAPFATSWHQVTVLPEDRPNVIRTNRPMVDHGNTPWYRGMRLWFPELDRLFTIREVNEVGGGFGGDTVELVEDVDLADEGVREGDWYVIYGIQPGLRVTVANDFCLRREPAEGWKQYALRATGDVSMTPLSPAAMHYQDGDGAWHESSDKRGFTATETGGKAIRLVIGKPDWLDLSDAEAPAVRITLDGRELSGEQARDLGWVEAPRQVVIDLEDAANPLDLGSLRVTFDGKRLDAPGAMASVESTDDGKALGLTVDLGRAVAEAEGGTLKHSLQVSAADRSVGRHVAHAFVSFMIRTPPEEGATYLSDLRPVKSFAHGGLIRDRDYVGNPAHITGLLYEKCLTLCPEPSPDGTHGEAIYKLPAEALAFRADVGISDSSQGNGSAVFMVQTSGSADGPWETRYTSPLMRGGVPPVSVTVPLEGPGHLRLYTTDAGDGINSDHALWGNARLTPAAQ